MNIRDLKQGNKIYNTDNYRVRHYTYLCVHPTGIGKYHILIDECEEPIRIYEDQLKMMLNKNLNSYQEAKLALADQLEDSAKRLRKEEPSL